MSTIPPLRLSEHAKKRMREFGLTPYQVVRMVHSAEVLHEHWRNGRVNVRAFVGDFCIVFDPNSGTIVTILRRLQNRWEHDPNYK